MSEHVILVAVNIAAPTRQEAVSSLGSFLSGVPEWWVAEDDRTDGSDNDSAVFVPYGKQLEYQSIVQHSRQVMGE